MELIFCDYAGDWCSNSLQGEPAKRLCRTAWLTCNKAHKWFITALWAVVRRHGLSTVRLKAQFCIREELEVNPAATLTICGSSGYRILLTTEIWEASALQQRTNSQQSTCIPNGRAHPVRFPQQSRAVEPRTTNTARCPRAFKKPGL